MNTSDHNARGFTLVEVLVGMALFAGLMLTLFSAFNAFTSSGAMIRDRQNYGELSGPGLRIMAADLSQIFILHPPQFQKPESEETEDAQQRYRFTGGRESVNGETVSFLR
ncbi:MAG: prepilin-type N-terminal cleavage/methylation domain-containing protein, partial [Desulfobacterales bacterium]|nr:prepilin-type N-terminal cleavage/methylation domain-containing protein [Desulfobacterales bacterium]